MPRRALPPAVHRPRLPARRAAAAGERDAAEDAVPGPLRRPRGGDRRTEMLAPTRRRPTGGCAPSSTTCAPRATSPRRAAATTSGSRSRSPSTRPPRGATCASSGPGPRARRGPAARGPPGRAARVLGARRRGRPAPGRPRPRRPLVAGGPRHRRTGRRPDDRSAVPTPPRRPSRTSGATSPRERAVGAVRRRGAVGTGSLARLGRPGRGVRRRPTSARPICSPGRGPAPQQRRLPPSVRGVRRRRAARGGRTRPGDRRATSRRSRWRAAPARPSSRAWRAWRWLRRPDRRPRRCGRRLRLPPRRRRGAPGRPPSSGRPRATPPPCSQRSAGPVRRRWSADLRRPAAGSSRRQPGYCPVQRASVRPARVTSSPRTSCSTS